MYYRSSSPFARLWSAAVALAMVLALLVSGAPPRAYAQEEHTLFQAEFDSAPLGALSGPLAVETGTVVPQEGNVAIAAAASGQALALDSSAGQATALLQWSNYPGALPISPTQELTLRIEADFTNSISSTAGASFGLLAGSSFFEFFSFGAGGTLTRGGASLGLSYVPSDTIHLDVHIALEQSGGQVRMLLRSAGGQKFVSVPLGSAFTAATLNQLRFQAPATSGVATIDHVLVRLTSEEEDDDPPAVIIIRDGDIVQEIENINGAIFVNIKIMIVNTGGKARGTFLVLDLDDLKELFDLADVSFLEGVGFVSQLDEHQVRIGLGQNNIVHSGGKIQVKIKFKVKQNRLDIKVNAHFRLIFNDTSGAREILLPAVVVIVPPVVPPGTTPIGNTPVLTPTTGITPTGGLTPTVIVIERLPLSRIDVRFTATWRARGGLDIFGLPLTDPITQTNGVVVQYFERVRMEWHPELAGTPYEVLLGLLAVELGHTAPPTAPPTSTTELRWYFPATGHLIATPFRTFWQTRGGLAIFGLPIGEALMEDGRLVQYFERARMELHPELAGTPYEVQLGHLGVQVLQQQMSAGR